MAKLTEKMKEMLSKHLPMVSTVSVDGMPNIGPKRTLTFFDDETLIYNENTGKQTYRNIQDNGKIAVAIVDWEKLDGYRFVGECEIIKDGDLFKERTELWKKEPKAVVKIHIKKIYTLKIGATAGDLIEG